MLQATLRGVLTPWYAHTNTYAAQESTKSVEMISEGSRSTGAGGATVYDYLYELDSTRGRKQILSTVRVLSRFTVPV